MTNKQHTSTMDRLQDGNSLLLEGMEKRTQSRKASRWRILHMTEQQTACSSGAYGSSLLGRGPQTEGIKGSLVARQ